MQKIIKLLIVAITLGMVLTTNVYAKPVNKNIKTDKVVKQKYVKKTVKKVNKQKTTKLVKQDVYEKKSKKYYKEFKEEWTELPHPNKKRIISSYQKGIKSGMGLTLAGTHFLESSGKLNTVSTNNNGDYTSYNCGDYGINTMTYLMSIGKKSKNLAVHKQACQRLIKDKQLNLSMALKVYNYAKDRYNNDTVLMWNYYASGRDKITGDRIYMMKAITTVLKEELLDKQNNIANNKDYNKFDGPLLAYIVTSKNKNT